VIDPRVVDAVAVPVADHRMSSGPPSRRPCLGHPLIVAVDIDDPLALAVHADLVDAVAVEVADTGMSPAWPYSTIRSSTSGRRVQSDTSGRLNTRCS